MIGTQEIIIILLIVLILFGGRKLPELARGIGNSLREFRKAASEVNKEEKECRRALVKLELAAQINGWKTGDKVLCYTSGWRQRDMESGFEPLDYRLTMDKLDDRDNYYDRFHVVELEIMDRLEDGKILAKSVHGKTLFMGVPLNDAKPILFFKVVK